MAALTAARVLLVPTGKMKVAVFPLKNGSNAWENGMACIDSANAGSVTQGAVSTTLKAIGRFTTNLGTNSSGGTVPVGVELERERDIAYWDSVASGGTITIANLFATVYIASDHELTTTSTGASVYGIVWAIGPQGYPGGVGVEPLF